MDAAELREAADRYVLGALRRDLRVVFTRASGCRLWDAAGNEYLDAISGTNGPAMVGHANPHVTAVVSEQLGRLPSTFLIHDSEPLIRFARRMDAISPVGPAKTFLCPGGGEAIEAAVKLAMRVTGRAEVVSLHGAYHGDEPRNDGAGRAAVAAGLASGRAALALLPAGAATGSVPATTRRGQLGAGGARARGHPRRGHGAPACRGPVRARAGARRAR
jgi:glutamate-1-semialdehyde aminotransferase